MILGARDKSQKRAEHKAEYKGHADGRAMATREMSKWTGWIREDREDAVTTVGLVPDAPYLRVMWPTVSGRLSDYRQNLKFNVDVAEFRFVEWRARAGSGQLRWFNLELQDSKNRDVRPLWFVKFARLCADAMLVSFGTPHARMFEELIEEARSTIGIVEGWKDNFRHQAPPIRRVE